MTIKATITNQSPVAKVTNGSDSPVVVTKVSTGPQGPTGSQGVVGPQGSQGDPGYSAYGRLYYFRSQNSDIPSYEELTISVSPVEQDDMSAFANNSTGDTLIVNSS